MVNRIGELSVENSTNLIHCNMHYKDLMRVQTRIVDLKHNLQKAQDEATALSGKLLLARKEMGDLTVSLWKMFKGFIKALWNKVVHRERSTEDGGE